MYKALLGEIFDNRKILIHHPLKLQKRKLQSNTLKCKTRFSYDTKILKSCFQFLSKIGFFKLCNKKIDGKFFRIN